jgi:glucan phosphoethanolaminetransferase (alkaline phosphatase superfamily)
MLKYYKYPLKIWLTSSLLGTLAYLLFLLAVTLIEGNGQLSNLRNLNSDNYFFMGVIAIIALVCSFPCFLILWAVYTRLMHRNVSIKTMKIMLSVLGTIIGSICLLSVYYFILNEFELKSVLELVLPYNTILVFSIWYFNLRPKSEVENGM